MADVDNIILEHLRHIRGAVDELRLDMREVTQHLGAVEREDAEIHIKISGSSDRIDRLSEPMERVERRLTDA